ncbi:MAG: PilZ domain-containing protein [Pseudomonadota bacterium]
MPKEARGDPRIDFRVAVNVQQESRLQHFYSSNLSSGGIFLEIEGDQPPVGSKLTLEFNVPLPKKLIKVSAEVVHHHVFDSLDDQMQKVKRGGIGLKFLDLNPEDQKLISQFITGKDLHVRA